MLGTEDESGILPFNRLFQAGTFKLRASYYEIYNEKVYDLLSSIYSSTISSKLRVREHKLTGPFVEGRTLNF
jgi:hypothetical protein